MKLRHVPRTHRISVDWIHQFIEDNERCFLGYVNTKQQMADTFDKEFHKQINLGISTVLDGNKSTAPNKETHRARHGSKGNNI